MRLSLSVLLVSLALCCYEANAVVCPSLAIDLSGFLFTIDSVYKLQLQKYVAPQEVVEAKLQVKQCTNEISFGNRVLITETLHLAKSVSFLASYPPVRDGNKDVQIIRTANNAFSGSSCQLLKDVVEKAINPELSKSEYLTALQELTSDDATAKGAEEFNQRFLNQSNETLTNFREMMITSLFFMSFKPLDREKQALSLSLIMPNQQ
ncbi:hypothetical protein HPG69_016061 [Diceros bicornis minor]|uniref:Uteroglobin n=1 Tax=Diceros bicornis minor TaxID=77932 RepID=A0A7J7FDA0_DICBM|nr:hypothetical protein HPG69_016061 [Diceros bicornis minor]